MKKLLLTHIISLFFSINLFSQKLITIKGHCGYYYKTIDDLINAQQQELKFYNFHPNETVASIGAQCCNWEAVYAATTDSLHFYLEDIDSTYFNKSQAGFAWKYYNTLRTKPMSSTYNLVLGDERKTNLPSGIFDKILIINSFHEFTFQKEMLADIAGKLKHNGLLYIDEVLARYSGQLHAQCKKRIYLDEELIGLLKQNGYEYVDGVILTYRKSKPFRKLFAFKKIF